MHADGIGHILVHQLVDTPGRALGPHIQGRSQTRHGLLRGLRVQDHAPAQEIVRVEQAQDQIRIRHGGLGPAPPIAGRPRIGSGAFRAHHGQAHIAQPGDAAAAGPYFNHVHHRHQQGQATTLLEAVYPRHFRLRGQGEIATRGEDGLGRGTAHVKGQDFSPPGDFAPVRRCQSTAAGTRFHQPHGKFSGRVHRARTTVGQHDVQRRPHATGAQSLFQALQVARG